MIDQMGIIINSLRRIALKLSEKEVQKIKDILPEEILEIIFKK